MKQNKNGRCFLFRFFSKQTMKHGDLLNDLPNPCNCETSLLSRTTHFTSKLISFSNFFLHRRSGYKDFYFEILVVQRWHILLLNFSDYHFFFLRLRSQTGSPRFADSKLEPARALGRYFMYGDIYYWEREWQKMFSMTKIGRFLRRFLIVKFSAVDKTQHNKISVPVYVP